LIFGRMLNSGRVGLGRSAMQSFWGLLDCRAA